MWFTVISPKCQGLSIGRLSSSAVSHSLQPHSPPGSSVHGILQTRITRVGCHALLQGVFPTQGSNPCLLGCRWVPSHGATCSLGVWPYFPLGESHKLKTCGNVKTLFSSDFLIFFHKVTHIHAYSHTHHISSLQSVKVTQRKWNKGQGTARARKQGQTRPCEAHCRDLHASHPSLR